MLIIIFHAVKFLSKKSDNGISVFHSHPLRTVHHVQSAGHWVSKSAPNCPHRQVSVSSNAVALHHIQMFPHFASPKSANVPSNAVNEPPSLFLTGLDVIVIPARLSSGAGKTLGGASMSALDLFKTASFCGQWVEGMLVKIRCTLWVFKTGESVFWVVNMC